MKGTARTIKRRRKEAKTDYLARLNLLKSGRSRLVVRKTNRYIIAQIVSSSIAQDKIIAGVSSKDLLLHGWPESQKGSLKNIAAAYLTGALLASKVQIDGAILDMGMHRNVKQSRIYGVVKGALDAGMKISCNNESLPTEKRIESIEKTRETFIKMREALVKHGTSRNKK